MKQYLLLLTLGLMLSLSTKAQEESVYTIVEDMPVFFGCDSEEGRYSKQECSSKAVIDYITNEVEKLKLDDVKKKSIVYVQFIVDTLGKVGSTKVLRGIDERPDLDKLALKIVESFPVYTPGRQRGKAVRVKYLIPVKFK